MSGNEESWPPVGRIDEEMILSALNTKQHQTGRNCQQLESEFAKWNGERLLHCY